MTDHLSKSRIWLRFALFCPLGVFPGGIGLALEAPVDEVFPVLRGDYLGQPAPGSEPELFAPGIVSNGLFNRDITISPDGNEIYFGLIAGDRIALLWSRRVDGVWLAPEFVPFAGGWTGAVFEPALSADGDQLLFLTNQAIPGQQEQAGWANQNIFVSERTAQGWGEPVPMPAPVNTTGMEFYPSLTDDGTIYYTRSNPNGQSAIWRSRFVDGAFAEPERLGDRVNCAATSVNAFIARDESYLIVCVRGHAENLGPVDYWIVFRDQGDRWSEPVNLGPRFNAAEESATSAYVTRDGKYLFFSSTRRDDEKNVPGGRLTMEVLQRLHVSPQNSLSDIYWVDAGFIEELRAGAAF